MGRPRVSIITPTFGREAFLPAIAACVQSQSCQEIEWLVLDDSEKPSAALSSMAWEKLKYLHLPQRLSIGEKRNRLVSMAKADIIVHFDDDDYYGPEYLLCMLNSLEEGKLDVALLCGFFAVHLNQGAIGYCRTMIKQGPAFEFNRHGVRSVLLETLNIPFLHMAYGWTYIYRKSVWARNHFREMSIFEDREFVRASCNDFRIKALEDESLNCFHSVHNFSASRCFPQFVIPEFVVKLISPEAAAHIAKLQTIAGKSGFGNCN